MVGHDGLHQLFVLLQTQETTAQHSLHLALQGLQFFIYGLDRQACHRVTHRTGNCPFETN